MNLDEFQTLERLPTAPELMSLCEELGLSFVTLDDGRPALRCQSDAREESKTLAKLLGREPWRTQVIEAKQLCEKKAEPKPEPTPEPVPEAAPEPPRKLQVVTVPPGAKIYAQLDGGRPCEPNDPAAYIWCYEGAAQWWYTKDAPIPRG